MSRGLHATVDRIEREAQARARLAEGWPYATAALVSAVWMAFTMVAANALALPLVTQLWLIVGLSPIPAALIELRHVRRRLEAALVLLDLPRNGH